MVTTRRDVIKCLGAAACSSLALRLQAADPVDAKKRRPLKVGQIGTGHAHASKLSVYLASPDYDVVGIAEPDAELRQAAERRAPYKDVAWMTQEQLLNVPDLDVVLVETRVRDLLSTAHACVAAGKHVHLDKPAGSSLPDYEKLLKAAEERMLMVQMGYMYRYNPAILLLHDFLERGWLGDVFEIHTVMSKVVDEASRRQLAEFPGGMMFELGCHIIDLVVGVLGAPDKVTAFPQHASPIEDDLVDNMLAVFEYPRATASVKTSAMEVEGFARRHFVVCGTGGTFHIQPLDNPVARIALSQPRGEYSAGYQEVKFPRFHRYAADAADMAKIIRGEKDVEYSYAHDLAVQTALVHACGISPQG